LKLRERLRRQSGEFVIWDVGLGAAANVLTVLRATRDLPCAVRIVSFDNTTAPLEFAWRTERRSATSTAMKTPCARFSTTPAPNAGWRAPRELAASRGGLSVAPRRTGRADDSQTARHFFRRFSPAKNPAMWTLPLFTNLFRLLETRRPCALATYSRSTMFRVTLLLAGFLPDAATPSARRKRRPWPRIRRS